MSSVPPDASAHDDRVDAAIAAYLEAVDRGESVDRDKFLRAHSDIAEELASFFDNQLLVRRITDSKSYISQPVGKVIDQSSPVVPVDANEATVKFEGDVNELFPDEDGHRLPERIGRYQVQRVLGQGGFGQVYLAYDEQLDRYVAVKVPHSRLVSRPESAAPYLAEARMVANLEHPNIVPVYDTGATEHFPCYVVSKFVAGSDLASHIKQHQLTFAESAKLVATIAEALDYAHRQGLVHRDVKPGNVLIDDSGKPFIIDFGLALRERDASQGKVYAGTPAYMSPEQARGEGHRVDGRSDIFSLGVTLYELLTGSKPFKAKTAVDLFQQIQSVEPPSLRQIDHRIPVELERICLKSLAKRATDRYATAFELAEDLRYFVTNPDRLGDLRTSNGNVTGAGGVETIGAGSTANAASSGSGLRIKIVPKGLRSFDEHDSEYFLDLLPGPRDRDGLPESLRFWKTRIEETDGDKTFLMGLIYGPSGCGKTSLVKAGLFPHLSPNVIPIYIEATAVETETRLLYALKKHCPSLSEDLTLTESLAALRRGKGIAAGQKIVIVLDQFEQWLHAKKEETNTELVQALRQCDGGRVQCVVMVRDDFWMAVTRFLRELEIHLLEGINSAAVDLFDFDHARKVLASFGRAFGRLPENPAETTKDQKEFIIQSVKGLVQEGKIICVRLAVFAEMMKGRVWIPASLKEVGGMQGVGVTFLEEMFSVSTAPPEHRYHQQAARLVLKSLLPETGSNIKGNMRSRADLMDVSGYADRPNDFEDLIRLLDSELRLITPTDPEGVLKQENDGKFDAGLKYYQLTHDYLVPSLRDWLTRKQRETVRGRAELRLAERAALWSGKQENRQLPSLWEYLTVVTLVPWRNRTEVERTMLDTARRVHSTRWGSGLAVALTLGLVVAWFVVLEVEKNKISMAVDAVLASRDALVPVAIRQMEQFPRHKVLTELKSRQVSANSDQQLALAFAQAAYGDVNVEFFIPRIERASLPEVDNLVTALRNARERSLQRIQTLVEGRKWARAWHSEARLAIVALHLEEDQFAIDMCRVDGRPDPIRRTIFIDQFAAWHGEMTRLAARCRDPIDPDLCSAICLGVGSIPRDQVADEERQAWQELFAKLYETASDKVTHSASGWALRQWKLPLPALATQIKQPGVDREWFVNSCGITLLRIQPGTFLRPAELPADIDLRNTEFDQNAKYVTIQLTRPFLLADREISVSQFRQFLDDPTCPDLEKREVTVEGEIRAAPQRRFSPTPEHPMNNISWYTEVRYCNWLSHKEGLNPFYERTGKKEKTIFNDVTVEDYDEWRPVPGATGYRLPTEAEWEYACRAGTTTLFSCGENANLLKKYAVTESGLANPCGSKLPNGLGLFDMHGNVKEWCQDWFGPYSEADVRDPIGPAADSNQRVVRGSQFDSSPPDCWSGKRFRFIPGAAGGTSGRYLGIRIARNIER